MQNSDPNTPAAKPSPQKALLMLVGVIFLIGGYITLVGLLGNVEFYAGFIFLLCWMVLEQGKLERFPHAVIGGAFGVALGYLLQQLVGGWGATGGYIFGALVLPILFCQFMGWLSLIINMTAMTFLAVVTIPHIQIHGNFGDTAIALLVSVIYFGLIIGGGGWLAARRGAKQAAQ